MDADVTSKEYEILKNDMRMRLQNVRSDISMALRKCGRSEDSLKLIGVSKFFPVEYARAASEIGLDDLGENRVQELLSKKEELDRLGIHPNWHMIGTLQKNKVRQIIGQTSLIHSVSSEDLLMEIQKRSLLKGISTSVLLQVNVSKEETKHGFTVDEMERIAAAAGSCGNINVCGLMTMAPINTTGHEAYAVFQKTGELFNSLKKQVRDPEKWNVLSMGMSQDYIDAIQCGATHIRIGTAIFGQRI